MEASDTAFGAGVESPQDDPFAGTDDGDFEQGADPFADGSANGEALPVVNKEGERLDDGTQVASPEEEAQLAEAQEAAEEAGVAVDAPDPTSGAASAAAATPPGTDSAAPPSGSDGEADSSPAATTDAAMSGEPDPIPASVGTPAQEEGSPAASDASAPAAATSDTPASATAEEEAEAPAEIKDPKTGAVTHRNYAVFVPEGPGLWREVSWFEKGGKVVKQGTQGAKKQHLCLARGQDEALATAFEALGAPEDGIPALVAVPVTYWKPKPVKPEPVSFRQRLKIG